MIIKGGTGGNVGFWARHLLDDDTNEAVRLVEIRGVLADDLPGALREMEAIAAMSRCRGKFLYQANLNPQPGEALTDEQWTQAIDLLEANLGLTGHQRVVVEHVKNGRRHRHVLWNRVNVESLKVVDFRNNYRVHTRTARELEQRFGLKPTAVPDPAKGNRKARRPELWEQRAAWRSGIDRDRMTDELTRIWAATTTGQEFRAAIETTGYLLARGDRRDFCIVDRAGDAHSLARRLRGVRAEDVRKRLADIDPATLPSVAEARARQRAKRAFSAAAKRLTAQAKPRTFRRAAARVMRPKVRYASNGMVMLVPLLRPERVRATVSEQSQSRTPGQARSAPSAPAIAQPDVARRPDLSGFDSAVLGRAEAAFRAVFAEWEGRIDAVSADRSLPPDQRAAAILALRARQQVEAEGARRRVVAEEEQRVRLAQRAARTPARPSLKAGRKVSEWGHE